ncbi:MAG: hypothetical protein ACMG6H_09510, partial [Acidobacteriota bacterium]
MTANADVEAKFGKGIFSSPKNQAHAPKTLEKKTVTRSAARADHPQRQTQRQTTASARQETAGGRQGTARAGETKPRPSESAGSGDLSSKPLGGPARRARTAADYNKEGDDFFDA